MRYGNKTYREIGRHAVHRLADVPPGRCSPAAPRRAPRSRWPELLKTYLSALALVLLVPTLLIGGERLYRRAAGLPTGENLLALGAMNGQVRHVREAIAGGARVDADGPNGFTALMWASAEGEAGTVLALIEAGADVNHVCPFGPTALTLAAQSGHVDVVRLLLDAGADPNLPADNGTTPLTAAAGFAHADVVDVLLARGGRVDQRGAHGRTPLIAAAAHAATTGDLLTRLLAAGADPRARDDHGSSARTEARDAGRADLLALLDASAHPPSSHKFRCRRRPAGQALSHVDNLLAGRSACRG